MAKQKPTQSRKQGVKTAMPIEEFAALMSEWALATHSWMHAAHHKIKPLPPLPGFGPAGGVEPPTRPPPTYP